MSLDANHESLLKDIYQHLAENPLQPGDPFYEPIYRRPDGEDPVAKLKTHIKRASVESLQLFSGFRGTYIASSELARAQPDMVLLAPILEALQKANQKIPSKQG